jgi:hypothetical protein
VNGRNKKEGALKHWLQENFELLPEHLDTILRSPEAQDQFENSRSRLLPDSNSLSGLQHVVMQMPVDWTVSQKSIALMTYDRRYQGYASKSLKKNSASTQKDPWTPDKDVVFNRMLDIVKSQVSYLVCLFDKK